MEHRTVVEKVMLAEVYRAEPRAGRRDRAGAALERIGLTERAKFLPSQLSRGERQRVAIARAVMGRPSLLLCDEPTGNLDSGTTATTRDLFGDLHEQGMTIIMITHEREVAARAGREVRIVDGVLTESR